MRSSIGQADKPGNHSKARTGLSQAGWLIRSSANHFNLIILKKVAFLKFDKLVEIATVSIAMNHGSATVDHFGIGCLFKSCNTLLRSP